MQITKDDKVNMDKVKYIIPSKRYAKPFERKISSEILHLAPTENHQNFFKGNTESILLKRHIFSVSLALETFSYKFT